MVRVTGPEAVGEYLTGSAVARILGVSHKTVVAWADAGRVEFVDTKLGRLYEPESVEALRLAREAGNTH